MVPNVRYYRVLLSFVAAALLLSGCKQVPDKADSNAKEAHADSGLDTLQTPTNSGADDKEAPADPGSDTLQTPTNSGADDKKAPAGTEASIPRPFARLAVPTWDGHPPDSGSCKAEWNRDLYQFSPYLSGAASWGG